LRQSAKQTSEQHHLTIDWPNELTGGQFRDLHCILVRPDRYKFSKIYVGKSEAMSTATARQNQLSIITVDLLLKVGRRTILHPFVAWMIPLSLRAQATPYHHLSFQISTAYALFLTIIYVLSVLNSRIAYGLPRSVDLSEEVVVITGGASGLGLLIADFYAMRGASVAVLDVKPKNSLQESKGITYYLCDVGDFEQVHNMAKIIKEDVC
jgi:hypothetical protein